VAAVESVIRDGLALRWAIIGNFGANHTDTDDGIERYGEAYRGLMSVDSSLPTLCRRPQRIGMQGALKH
jgi:hypothetical protein